MRDYSQEKRKILLRQMSQKREKLFFKKFCLQGLTSIVYWFTNTLWMHYTASKLIQEIKMQNTYSNTSRFIGFVLASLITMAYIIPMLQLAAKMIA